MHARRHNWEPEHEDREQPAVQVGGEGAADVDVPLGPRCCGQTKHKWCGGAGSDVGVKYSRAEPNVWIPITSNEHYPIGLQRWIRCTNEPCNQVHIYAMHAAVHAPCGTSW